MDARTGAIDAHHNTLVTAPQGGSLLRLNVHSETRRQHALRHGGPRAERQRRADAFMDARANAELAWVMEGS